MSSLLLLLLSLFARLHLTEVLLLKLLTLLTFPLSDVLVQSVSVLGYVKLLVVVNRYANDLVAGCLLCWVTELGYIRMCQSLLNCQAFGGIEC